MRRSFSHVSVPLSVHLITLQVFQDGISHNLERQLYTFCFCKVLLDSWVWHRTLPLRWWDVKKKVATKRSGLRWFVQMNAVTNTQPVPPCDLGKPLGFDGMGWDTAATSNSVLGFRSNLQVSPMKMANFSENHFWKPESVWRRHRILRS